jgi:hypothetical protein
MNQVNYRTYQLLKEGKVILETEAATFDRAIDYFLVSYPDAYVSSDYTFKYVRMSHE